MKQKLFVLFVVLILCVSLIALFRYDKKVLNEEKQNEVFKNNEIEIEEEELPEEIYESEDVLGELKIEKIGLVGKIKEGSSNEILKEYIGHIEETSKYDGNVGLAAHNRGNVYSYFSRINELENGDEIIYETKYGKRIYIVSEKREILETDWSMLGQTNENRLTLITCIKNRVNQRLCVQAVEKKI